MNPLDRLIREAGLPFASQSNSGALASTCPVDGLEDLLPSERIAIERDIYRRLLDLHSGTSASDVLQDVLSGLLQLAGAASGFVQCKRLDGEPLVVASAMAHEGVENLLETLSSGIVGTTLTRGEVVRTSSAVLDPRFDRFASVRRGAIEAVICAPIPPGRGVVYLQGPSPVSDDIAETIERVAVAIAPVVARHLVQAAAMDPTAVWRERLGAQALVGRSDATARVLREAALFAPQPVTVLLTGPTGTGKSALAEIIHRASAVSDGPFVDLNCAALPDELVESELFGAVPGAHSTATKAMPGKVDAAAGGTLFLDEVGELSPGVQAKLLQLTQNGVYRPLGSNDVRRCTARIVAATNVDLAEATKKGSFRSDLYHRLSGFTIQMPALSERRGDVPIIAEALLARACSEMDLPTLHLDQLASMELAVREWPGNIRELDNAIRRAAVFAAAENSVRVSSHHFDPSGAASSELLSYADATRAFQRQLLADALERCGGQVSDAASELVLARSHVYALIKEHGLR